MEEQQVLHHITMLRNSKAVNKPFRSPFKERQTVKINNNDTNVLNTLETNSLRLQERVSTPSKRTAEQSPVVLKKSRIDTELKLHDNSLVRTQMPLNKKVVEYCVDRSEDRKTDIKLQANGSISRNIGITPDRKTIKPSFTPKCLKLDIESNHGKEDVPNNIEISQKEIEVIQKRIREKRLDTDHLKKRLLYSKKNAANDLRADIKKWRSICQEALERLRKEFQEKQGHLLTMIQLLTILGISKDVVKYSLEEDGFF